jgi:hypothetical protein
MTASQNPVSVLEAFEYPQSLPVTTNITINEGDLVFWDGTNYTVTPLTANTDVAAKFLGAALGQSPSAVYGGDPAPSCVGVLGKGCIYVYGTNGETYNHFDDVTIGADSQTVVKSGATSGNRVGFVIIDPPQVARALQATPVPETIVAVTGTRIRIQLEPKFKVGVAL